MSVTCPTVTVTAPSAPANITANAITPNGAISCSGACTKTFYLQWINNGQQAGSFVPKLVIGGTTVYGNVTQGQSQTLQPGSALLDSFTVEFTTAGTYTVCPVPN